MKAGGKGAGSATGIKMLMLLSSILLSADETVAQDMMPPGSGRTVSGPSSLIDMGAPPNSSLLNTSGWWISATRPYGLPGVMFVEAAAAVAGKSRSIGLAWQQLAGDGLRHIRAELDCSYPIIREETEGGSGSLFLLIFSAGGGFERLSGSESEPLTAGIYRVGTAAVHAGGWRAALLYRDAFGRNREWIAGRLEWAFGYMKMPLSVRFGGRLSGQKSIEHALSVSCYRGRTRFDIGGWGTPPAPGFGMYFEAVGFRWSFEGRLVPGPGIYMLWSVSRTARDLE